MSLDFGNQTRRMEGGVLPMNKVQTHLHAFALARSMYATPCALLLLLFCYWGLVSLVVLVSAAVVVVGVVVVIVVVVDVIGVAFHLCKLFGGPPTVTPLDVVVLIVLWHCLDLVLICFDQRGLTYYIHSVGLFWILFLERLSNLT